MGCFYNIIRVYKERKEFSDGEFELRGMIKFNKQQRFVHKQPGSDGLRVRRPANVGVSINFLRSLSTDPTICVADFDAPPPQHGRRRDS